MKLSEHFTVEEFCASDTAERLHINNDLPGSLIYNAHDTMNMAELVRSFLGDVAMHITSGYRCLPLNRAIGSKDTSDHVQAWAIDFTAPAFGTPLQIARKLAPWIDRLRIGQLIFEHSWCHIAYPHPQKALNRVLTVQAGGYTVGIIGD